MLLFKRDCNARHVHRHSSQHVQDHDTTRWCYYQWNVVIVFATRWLSLSSVVPRRFEIMTPSVVRRITRMKKIPAKFYPDLIWNDGALGFHGSGRSNTNKNKTTRRTRWLGLVIFDQIPEQEMLWRTQSTESSNYSALSSLQKQIII